MEVKYSGEKELERGLKNGEADAFEVLLDVYGDRVLRICYLLLKDLSSAEDITQEVFIKIYKSINKFKGKSSLYTWIYRIAVNACRDELKKRNDYVSFEDTVQVKSDVDLENEILSYFKGERVRECVFLLKSIYREVIVLYYFQELSVLEICEVLDEKENTVKSRLKRARAILKNMLIKEEIFYEEG
jgi:RNA polymerase sigma-70 factor (ECF subfamily)